MFRSVASKVAWVGRTASMVFGLALVFGVAATAWSATGGNFILGKANGADRVSKLTANIAGPALTLVNQSTEAAATALNLNVASGKVPLKVNAGAGTATNLSADELDGLDSTDVGRQRWAVINADGTIARSNGAIVNFTRRLKTGHCLVDFNTNVRNCAYVATTTGGFAGQTGVQEGLFSTEIEVFTNDSVGAPTNLPFHLIVTC